MLDTFRIYTDLKKAWRKLPQKKIAGVFSLVYEELRQSVTKTEFNELRGIVQELAQAQNRTEQRVEELT